ncbi:MAG: hypothetical protein KatS3mg058_1681 [Roseiflexus sp.]|jgi:hypothetical protein|nr:MAG: hypothetical protein KatS3mg058_1681 [Roseiflexus sp.]
MISGTPFLYETLNAVERLKKVIAGGGDFILNE